MLGTPDSRSSLLSAPSRAPDISMVCIDCRVQGTAVVGGLQGQGLPGCCQIKEREASEHPVAPHSSECHRSVCSQNTSRRLTGTSYSFPCETTSAQNFCHDSGTRDIPGLAQFQRLLIPGDGVTYNGTSGSQTRQEYDTCPSQHGCPCAHHTCTWARMKPRF